MDRDQFLQKQWRPYPSLDWGRTPFRPGRVTMVGASDLTFQGATDRWTISHNDCRPLEDAALGSSCPPQLLKEGDWVVWDNERGGLFLVSPCRSQFQKPSGRDPVAWSNFLSRVESFFVDQGFHHLRTPYLVESPGVDHHIDFMEVTAAKTGRRWTLPTSPEIHLKKLLCQGYWKIFEIKNCFRDDLSGPQHRAEFMMLEWYRSFANLEDLMLDVEALLKNFDDRLQRVDRISLAQLFEKKLGYLLSPKTSKEELRDWANRLGVETHATDDWNDLFFRIFMEKVESDLGRERPVLVFGFPPQQASLAQINSEGWAERFELYWRGTELANAYLEVNDPEVNRRRFAREAELREVAWAKPSPMDSEFFDLMEMGMPPASGIALGLDRLYACLSEQSESF